MHHGRVRKFDTRDRGRTAWSTGDEARGMFRDRRKAARSFVEKPAHPPSPVSSLRSSKYRIKATLDHARSSAPLLPLLPTTMHSPPSLFAVSFLLLLCVSHGADIVAKNVSTAAPPSAAPSSAATTEAAKVALTNATTAAATTTLAPNTTLAASNISSNATTTVAPTTTGRVTFSTKRWTPTVRRLSSTTRRFSLTTRRFSFTTKRITLSPHNGKFTKPNKEKLGCHFGEIQCMNGKCVERQKVCDGHLDCQDILAADENSTNCDIKKTQCHGPYMERCPNTNICVQKMAFCDGINDCGDNADEDREYCAKIKCIADEGWTRCSKSRRCIPDAWVCDGNADCSINGYDDLSDEGTGVCKGKDTCWGKPHLFKCETTHQCVPRFKICDGVQDCIDNSDELQSCGNRTCASHEFECTANRKIKKLECISKEWLCDGTPHCLDGADEKKQCGEQHKTDTCRKGEFRCNYGRCIPEKWKCDGEEDCLDGSDEFDHRCPAFTCQPSQYKCSGAKRCISKKWICDGEKDCPRGDDETC